MIHVLGTSSYMYLDASGDGSHQAEEHLKDQGPTLLGIWLSTDLNKLGYPAECISHDGALSIISYEMILRATGGTVAWGPFTNNQPGMDVSFLEASSPTEYHNGFGGMELHPPGLYKVGELQVTVLSGNPRIDIVPSTVLSGGFTTSFGSNCFGTDYDNTLKLGTDWTEVDGVGPPGPDMPPSIIVPATIAASEGVPCQFELSISDPDGGVVEAFSAEVASLPAGCNAQFQTNLSARTAAFAWTPGATDGRPEPYVVRFTASTGVPPSSAIATTEIVVSNANRPPVASAGGTYGGVVGSPIQFVGDHSSDPDTDPLQFTWDFGDGATSHSMDPLHNYAEMGDYVAHLSVSDGQVASLDSAAVSIQGALPATAFLADSTEVIYLASAKSSWCFELEPEANSFNVSELDGGSIELAINRGGTVTSVPLEARSLHLGADMNSNGVPEASLCFEAGTLRAIFADLAGQEVLAGVISGDAGPGRAFSAPVTATVIGLASGSDVIVTPNPMRAPGAIVFRTRKPGTYRVQVFDVSGRLVRESEAVRANGVGYHSINISSGGSGMDALPSGVYFYRLESPDGATKGRFVVLK